MKRSITFVFFLALVVSACGPSQEQIQATVQASIAETQAALPTVTNTPLPTNTPEPTETPSPTNTPQPTATATPAETPITLSGNGDAVVDIKKWNGAAIVHITHNGAGHFSVNNYSSDNERIDLLANTIGNYDGTVPLDFLDDEDTARFEVKADGQWELHVLPFTEMRKENIPGTFEGAGDDVIFIFGSGIPDTLTVDASQTSGHFAIWGWGQGRDLLVNELAPYTGTVLVPAKLPSDGVLVLAITAIGKWSIDVKTK